MSNHSKLAPVMFDYIPKGRGPADVMFYKLMRKMARVHRQHVWDLCQQGVTDMILHGEGSCRIDNWGDWEAVELKTSRLERTGR